MLRLSISCVLAAAVQAVPAKKLTLHPFRRPADDAAPPAKPVFCDGSSLPYQIGVEGLRQGEELQVTPIVKILDGSEHVSGIEFISTADGSLSDLRRL